MLLEDTGTHYFGHNEQNSEKPIFRSKYLSQVQHTISLICTELTIFVDKHFKKHLQNF